MWRVPANDRDPANETMQMGSSPLDQKVNAPASEYGYVRPDHHASATSGISNLGGPRIERIATLGHNTFADTLARFSQLESFDPTNVPRKEVHMYTIISPWSLTDRNLHSNV